MQCNQIVSSKNALWTHIGNCSKFENDLQKKEIVRETIRKRLTFQSVNVIAWKLLYGGISEHNLNVDLINSNPPWHGSVSIKRKIKMKNNMTMKDIISETNFDVWLNRPESIKDVGFKSFWEEHTPTGREKKKK